MKEIILEPDEVFTVQTTKEGRIVIKISNTSNNNNEDLSTTEQSSCSKRNEEYEGDYKGENLNKVKMVKSEILSLESSLGPSCLKYWIISLNSFADNEPAKFKKYKCHRACIQNWHKMRLEKGMVFSHIHPSGPGYYFRRDVESLKQEQLKLR